MVPLRLPLPARSSYAEQMRAFVFALSLLGAGLVLSACTGASTAPSPDHHTQVVVRIAPWLIEHRGSGRVIVFFTRFPAHVLHYAPGGQDAIFSEDVQNAGPGSSFTFEQTPYGYPARRLDDVPPGTYYVMALLDWDGTYAYAGVSPGMYLSSVSRVKITPGTRVTLELSRPAIGHGEPYSKNIRSLSVASPELSAFAHRAVALHGVVVLPPGYASSTSAYPVVYVIHAFHSTGELTAFDTTASTLDNNNFNARSVLAGMRSGTIPKMIYVFPDANSALGHTEFANSANNGPWGAAFVDDLVPYVAHTYHVRSNAQFLTGHSSGAWSALWLQLRYPKIFAGAWAVSPDPVDFRSFLGTNIYEAHANMYQSHGREKTYRRAGNRTILTVRQAAQIESAEGRLGGQLASFEAVFSPRGRDGLPERLFDRETGAVNERVAAAWKKYDISAFLAAHGSQLRTELRGKLHIVVGAQDTYRLNEAVSLLKARLPKDAGDSATIVPGRNHFNIYAGGLAYEIVHQMDRAFRANREVARLVSSK